MTSSTDDSRGPTDGQLGRKLAALRQVMGLDVETLAARSQLAVELIMGIEAGTHSANIDELSDLVYESIADGVRVVWPLQGVHRTYLAGAQSRARIV